MSLCFLPVHARAAAFPSVPHRRLLKTLAERRHEGAALRWRDAGQRRCCPYRLGQHRDLVDAGHQRSQGGKPPQGDTRATALPPPVSFISISRRGIGRRN